MKHLTLPLLALCSILSQGCSDADARRLRGVGDKTYIRAAGLAQRVWDEVGQTLLEQKQTATPVTTDVAARVTHRFQWDRDLTDLEIKVELRDESLILSGAVATDAMKQYAQELAERTLGVRKVQNDLIVEPAKGDKPSPRNPD
jgi:osmotically-inducible protein OsmY